MRFKSGLPAVMASGAVVALGMVAGFPGGGEASTLAEAGSQPGANVADLLVRVPQLAGDVPNASSISIPAGGKSASGGVSGAERGRLVPLGIPGHPWTSKSTAPHRGVAASVTYRVGRLSVSVLYSASRGHSDTSVGVRTVR